MKSDLIYVAAPYTHPNPNVVEYRVSGFVGAVQDLTLQGYHVVSPLMFLFLGAETQLPSDWDYWQHYSRNLLSRCTQLLVLTFPGWEDSVGVTGEIEFAKEHNIPIHYGEFKLVVTNP